MHFDIPVSLSNNFLFISFIPNSHNIENLNTTHHKQHVWLLYSGSPYA